MLAPLPLARVAPHLLPNVAQSQTMHKLMGTRLQGVIQKLPGRANTLHI
jgi:hypothetical protein